ncbi:MAG TPA: hypothetical protein VFJ02_12350, partial [Vicinamibacterales bacterium]|nr:hypothetical protein [Vicinamibacterales bacterium]
MPRWLLVATTLWMAIAVREASAQTVEVAPFGGYRFGGDLFERVTGQPVDLDGAPAAGGLVNVAIGDGLWFEGLYSHQAARVTVGDSPGVPSRRWRIVVDHWLAGGLQEFGEGRARPFLTGLLGLTRYAADKDNEIRFVVSAGGGVKLQPAPRVGIRLDGRVFTTFTDVDGRAIACSPGACFFAFHADVVWQAEFSAGV